MLTKSKRDERAEQFRMSAWEGAEVVTAAGSRGVIADRWEKEGDAARVTFADGTEAVVDYADLRAAPVACVYDVGAARAELARRKPASAVCGKTFSPKLPEDPTRARCPACDKTAEALNAKHRRKLRREHLARARSARRIMPNLYAELRRIDRTRQVFYLIPHVARSGMSRRIELFYALPGGKGVDVLWPDYEPGEGATARELETLRRRIDWSRERRCFVVGGCGMDMVFWLVDHLGSVFGFENWGNKIHRSGLSRAE